MSEKWLVLWLMLGSYFVGFLLGRMSARLDGVKDELERITKRAP